MFSCSVKNSETKITTVYVVLPGKLSNNILEMVQYKLLSEQTCTEYSTLAGLLQSKFTFLNDLRRMPRYFGREDKKKEAGHRPEQQHRKC